MTDETCQFATYDGAGNAIKQCRRTDYKEFEWLGDTVRLCPRHASWLAAMGVPE